jgi:predicted phage terminase large subunit-like protein
MTSTLLRHLKSDIQLIRETIDSYRNAPTNPERNAPLERLRSLLPPDPVSTGLGGQAEEIVDFGPSCETVDGRLTLWDFGRVYFGHHLTALPSKMHRGLWPILERHHASRGNADGIIAPRGSAKSTWATLIDPIYCQAYNLEKYEIVISDVQTNANKFLKGIKDEIESNEALLEDFPQLRPGKVWREEAIEFAGGGRIESLGKGGKIRGRRHRQHRPSRIRLDDPQNLEDAYSEAQLDKDLDWLRSDVLRAGDPHTNFLCLGTALATKCIVCALKESATWKAHHFKQLLAEPLNYHLWLQLKDILFRYEDQERVAKARAFYEAHPEMNDGAEVLWPERFPLYDVMVNRFSNGERAFMQEEQGIPMAAGTASFPPEYFDHESFWFDQWPTNLVTHVVAVDPSKGRDAKIGDYQAIVRLGVECPNGLDKGRVLYVEAWLERWPVAAMCDLVVETCKNRPHPECGDPVDALGLEVNGFQELLSVPIQQAAGPFIMPEVRPLNNMVNKLARVNRLDGHLARREFRFKRSPGTQLLVQQLKDFPNGTHDDGPDALEMALRVAIQVFNERFS